MISHKRKLQILSSLCFSVKNHTQNSRYKLSTPVSLRQTTALILFLFQLLLPLLFFFFHVNKWSPLFRANHSLCPREGTRGSWRVKPCLLLLNHYTCLGGNGFQLANFLVNGRTSEINQFQEDHTQVSLSNPLALVFFSFDELYSPQANAARGTVASWQTIVNALIFGLSGLGSS